jgi:hypothetical protein
MKTPVYYAFPGPMDPGLTKRELFAAMAMQGIVSASGHGPKICAERAVECADALIAELSK